MAIRSDVSVFIRRNFIKQLKIVPTIETSTSVKVQQSVAHHHGFSNGWTKGSILIIISWKLFSPNLWPVFNRRIVFKISCTGTHTHTVFNIWLIHSIRNDFSLSILVSIGNRTNLNIYMRARVRSTMTNKPFPFHKIRPAIEYSSQ